MSDKPFEATPHRLERAKREGDIAASHELSAVAAFACALAACALTAAPIAAVARGMLFDAAAGRSNTLGLVQAGSLICITPAAAAAGALLCGTAQAGGLRFSGLKVQLSRLAPGENLKRMFSREAVVTAVRAIVAFACAALAIGPSAAALAGAATSSAAIPPLASATWAAALRAAWIACGTGAAFAGIDYALQVARRRKRLRMSYDELKRENKEHEGDPLARGRRKALHRALSRGSLRKVKEAAFVLTNPTHIAMALEYRPPDVPVPRVLVRAADDVAAAVRALAAEHGIPVIENPPLARALYANTQPGDFIPQETYVAVAEVVAALVKSGALQ